MNCPTIPAVVWSNERFAVPFDQETFNGLVSEYRRLSSTEYVRSEQEADEHNEAVGRLMMTIESLNVLSPGMGYALLEELKDRSDSCRDLKYLVYDPAEEERRLLGLEFVEERTPAEKAEYSRMLRNARRRVPDFCRRKPRWSGRPKYKVQTTGLVKRILFLTRDLDEAREFAQEHQPCEIRVAPEKRYPLCSENDYGGPGEAFVYFVRRVKVDPREGLWYARLKISRQVSERECESFVITSEVSDGWIKFDSAVWPSVEIKEKLTALLKRYSYLNRKIIKAYRRKCDETPPNIDKNDAALLYDFSMSCEVEELQHAEKMRRWRDGEPYPLVPI